MGIKTPLLINDGVPKMQELSENLRPKQAAKYLGIGLSSLWRLIANKKIKSIKLSERTTIIKKAELDAFVAAAEVA